MSPLVVAVIVLSGIGLSMAVLLAIGRKIFPSNLDERHEKLMDILPGANCGGCGYPGCSGYAQALLNDNVAVTFCPPGGSGLAQEVGALLGVEVGEILPMKAIVACAGDSEYAPERAQYHGVATCSAAHTIAGGPKKCVFGCLGLGDCVTACTFGAISISKKGLAIVNLDLCNGCGQCVAACPRDIIHIAPAQEQVHVLCTSPLKMKQIKAACSVGCTGCKICVKQSNGRIVMDGALAKVDYESSKEFPEHACLSCPQGAIFDARRQDILSWITDPSTREKHERDSDDWKAAEKKRKTAAKEAKKAKEAKEVMKKEGSE
jgi:H+/Na+-translocating ferredoxin:NAD+ oxidoreductase subunit B